MRIGLIGAGAVAPLHARAAALLPDVTLTAVCDLVPHLAAAVSADARVFTDYTELLDSGLVDAVIVNTPHSLHRDMVVAAARRGLHVLVEKPLATDLADCDAMARACAAAGVTLVVGHIQHFLPDKRALAQTLAGGGLGEVLAVHDFRSTDYRPGTRSPWFFSRATAGGGALMNIGAHCFDRTLWFGQGPARSVSATLPERFGVGVETDAVVTLQLLGAAATVTVVSDVPLVRDEVTVVAEGGVLVADPRHGTFLRRDGETRTLYAPHADAIPDAFLAQLADFLAAVAGEPPAVSLAHSRHVVELVLAAYASAAAGGAAVDLEPAPLAFAR